LQAVLTRARPLALHPLLQIAGEALLLGVLEFLDIVRPAGQPHLLLHDGRHQRRIAGHNLGHLRGQALLDQGLLRLVCGSSFAVHLTASHCASGRPAPPLAAEKASTGAHEHIGIARQRVREVLHEPASLRHGTA
jgi:hypothetical protein